MVKKSSGLLTVLLIGFILILPSLAAAKAEPVPGVMEMFNNFNELEESFRSGEWEEAAAKVEKIEQDYKNLVKDLKGAVDGKTIQKFGFLIGSFKNSLASKDKESVEKPFVNLQSMFIEIMDNYDYPAPPVLIILARYLEEAKEAVEKGNLSEAGEELEEISEFKDRASKAFSAQGVSSDQIAEFFEMIEQGERLATNKDTAGMTALLAKLTPALAPYALTKE